MTYWQRKRLMQAVLAIGFLGLIGCIVYALVQLFQMLKGHV